MSAGVLVFDAQFALSISNLGASTILGEERDGFAEFVRTQFREQGEKPWQLDFQLKVTGKTVHARGAQLPEATGGGYVVVFDDITQMIHAQRALAWPGRGAVGPRRRVRPGCGRRHPSGQQTRVIVGRLGRVALVRPL